MFSGIGMPRSTQWWNIRRCLHASCISQNNFLQFLQTPATLDSVATSTTSASSSRLMLNPPAHEMVHFLPLFGFFTRQDLQVTRDHLSLFFKTLLMSTSNEIPHAAIQSVDVSHLWIFIYYSRFYSILRSDRTCHRTENNRNVAKNREFQ